MNTRKLLVGVLALIGAALLLIFWPSGQTPEDEIRELLTDMALAAEEGDIGEVMEPISEEWHDASGMNKDALRGVLMREMVRGRTLHVVLGPIFVEIQEPEASASFEMWLAEDNPLWPDNSEVLRAEVELRREEGDWRIRETRVRQVSGDVVDPR